MTRYRCQFGYRDAKRQVTLLVDREVIEAKHPEEALDLLKQRFGSEPPAGSSIHFLCERVKG